MDDGHDNNGEGSSNPPPTETLDERHTRLLRETEMLKKQRECEEMQRLIDGRPPVDTPSIGATALAPLSQDHERRIQIRAARPATFKGKDLKEYEEYEASWKVQLAAQQIEGLKAISLAATYLEDDAQKAWVHEDNKPVDWTEYLQWCRNIVSDPQNRLSHALQALKRLQQTTQSTREMWIKLKGIKRDIPDMQEKEKDAWDLLSILTPEVRDRVLTDHDDIKTPDQVLLSAKKYEDRKKERSYMKREFSDDQPSRGPFRKRTQISEPKKDRVRKPGFFTKEREARAKQEKEQARFSCYNCGRSGHKKADCTAPIRSANTEVSHGPKN